MFSGMVRNFALELHSIVFDRCLMWIHNTVHYFFLGFFFLLKRYSEMLSGNGTKPTTLKNNTFENEMDRSRSLEISDHSNHSLDAAENCLFFNKYSK